MNIKRIFEKHPRWQEIVEVAGKISSNGYKVFLAGGCVRDALIGRMPHDFDIATEATPDEVQKIFPEALGVGREFGVMILPFSGYQIEVATFRKDGEYIDGRHPEAVEFSEPELDAQRRDFTVNGLFYDFNSGQIIDYVSGVEDLNKKIIRAIGSPELRFKEDKLRMLRAARFSAQLGFDIEEKTLKAISQFCEDISQVSKERITDEFKKLAKSADPIKGFVVLKSTGLFRCLFSNLSFVDGRVSASITGADNSREIDFWHLFLRSLNELLHILSLEILIANLVLFEGLFRQAKEKDLKDLLSSLPFVLSRESKREIEFLIHGFFTIRDGRDESLLLLNEDSGPLLTELCFVFASFKLFPKDNVSALLDRFLKVSDLSGHLPKAYLSGEDLINLGVSPSAQMGDLLKQSYMAQIKGEITSKDQALSWVKGRL